MGYEESSIYWFTLHMVESRTQCGFPSWLVGALVLAPSYTAFPHTIAQSWIGSGTTDPVLHSCLNNS